MQLLIKPDIKPENYGKIPEIYRKNPLKILKICRRA